MYSVSASFPSLQAIACVLLLSLLVGDGFAQEIGSKNGRSHRKEGGSHLEGGKSNGGKEFNVVEYGATGDGKTPDTKAFQQAWEAACSTAGSVRLIVPEGKAFLVEPTSFNGSCQASSIDVQILGKIVAPTSISAWDGRSLHHWLVFYEVAGMSIQGKGTIDGQGPVWWKCKNEKRCERSPAALYLGKCNNVAISDLNFVNSQGVHVKIVSSKDIRVSNIHLTAPDESPNTDGINVGTSENVQIHDCNIQTGDDCVAIIGDSRRINVTNILCGPGHGISIGSLGKNGAEDTVEDVYVKNAKFFRTSNGARIKTWQGGRGLVRNVRFERLQFTEVKYPIIIDQFYCPDGGCPKKEGAVKIEDVTFIEANGTTTSEIAINLKCSDSVSCTGIVVDHVNVASVNPEKKATSYCINSQGTSGDNVQPPVPCLLKGRTSKSTRH